MRLNTFTPKQTINKAYLKEKISQSNIDIFKKHFHELLDKIDEKGDEEHLKSLVADFLKYTWYKDSHQINPIGKNDLVIHTGKSPSDPVGVLIEVKSPSNKVESLTENKPNSKALHELILYYLRERIDGTNNEIKYLIATNIYEWFIIDANEFDKKIFRNSSIKHLYELKKKDGKDNPWFYTELKVLLDKSDLCIDATKFDLRNFSKQKDDRVLIPLFKILSPVHLLKLPFANDSNTLQPKFYSELLHIIGLYEYKEGSKKLISRKKDGERNDASLLENTIVQLESHDKISRIEKPSQYGDNYNDRLYNVALELVITWVNRVLFLKLLEAQLISYHRGDKNYSFLNKEKLRDFDDLDKLFFRVLAIKPANRNEDIQKLFGYVPYLNSSLFEPTELEHQTLFINGLEDFKELPVVSNTVLTDNKGKTLKGKLQTLDYLFGFLNAYDFSSEGAEEIQVENKTLINASVLGLIFEKINGYKDGSFFTPGFITMYMCRETIRRAVVQKFNDAKQWDCKEYSELYDKITDKKEANELINGLKICDPAVGSGHFLVSALNEIIAIKSDLQILQYHNSNRTLRDYKIEVQNDELIIIDDDGNLFQYNPQNAESQRVQETLFHEKQAIIEGCLFGVDINPNSVKICRLRLWIELLKNAYYKAGSKDLETLPNIDINIKTGNSLISRFALDADLKQALRNTSWNINDYKIAVASYKNATDKEAKRELVRLIETIKSNFRTSISRNAKEYKELSKLRGQLDKLIGSNEDLFGVKKRNKKDMELEQRRLEMAIDKQETAIEEIKNNKIYENAFEWRFEFPEVLNDEGEFLGFDVVIGNPPYISIQDLKSTDRKLAEQYKSTFKSVQFGNYDIYIPFIEIINKITNPSCSSSYILPSKFFTTDYGLGIRSILIKNELIESIIDFGHNQVFSNATVYTCIIHITKTSKQELGYIKIDPPNVLNDFSLQTIKYKSIEGRTWVFNNNYITALIEKVKIGTCKLLDLPCDISRGSSTGQDDIFVLTKIKDKFFNGLGEEVNVELDSLIRPLYATDFTRFNFKPYSSKYLIFPYKLQTNSYSLLDEKEFNNIFPLAYAYLFSKKLMLDRRKAGGKWYAYSAARSLHLHSIADILIPLLANRGLFSLAPKNKKSTLMAGGGFSITIRNPMISPEYLLALLNSKLLFFLLYIESNKFRGDYITCTKQYIGKLPIKFDKMIDQFSFSSLVTSILKAKNLQLDTLKLEKQLDMMVYNLYKLNSEEIKIIEDSIKDI